MGGDEQGIRSSFNLFGWQIVFFSGLASGVLTASKKVEWSRLFRPEAPLIPKLYLMTSLFFLLLRLTSAHGLLPDHVLVKFATMEIRADFGPVYLLNFLAVATGVTWLLSLGFPPLLGRHSLHVYVWHVAVVYVVFYIDQRTPEFSQLTDHLGEPRPSSSTDNLPEPGRGARQKGHSWHALQEQTQACFSK